MNFYFFCFLFYRFAAFSIFLAFTFLFSLFLFLSDRFCDRMDSSNQNSVNESNRQTERLQECLRSMGISNSGTFKNEQQERLLKAVCFSRNNVFAVLPTGSGKSLAFFCNALINNSQVTVVVVPLIALQKNLLEKSSQYGITASVSLDDVHRVSLLILSYDDCLNSRFNSRMAVLAGSGYFNRIMIDEAHCSIVDASFRESMFEIDRFRALGVPFVLLTATCPAYVKNGLKKKFFPLGCFKMIQYSSNRKNLQYSIVKTDNLFEKIEHLVWNKLRQLSTSGETSDAKGIIFFNCKTMLEGVHDKFKKANLVCSRYYSDLVTKEEEFCRWQNGLSPIILCTSAFGLGVDIPNVSFVYFCGLPYSVIDFVQQAGRAGRGGQNGEVKLVFSSSNEWARIRCMGQCEQAIRIQELLQIIQSKRCIRAALTEYIDSSVITCLDDDEQLRCSNCSNSEDDE